jgi:p-cumate 2,3-dioxygenase alpha subunit
MSERQLGGLLRVDEDRAVFQVSRRVFLDPEVLKAEHETIFRKCWLYIGHDSEISEPGSFVTRKVAGRSFIFNRDAEGEAHAFYNVCPHRGGEVCREKRGTSRSFQCFYHGWVFAADGRLRYHPQEDLYPADFQTRQNVGLQSVPRIEQYRGFWFICLDANAMSLSDYLAGAKEYLELVADQSAAGMTIIPGGQEFTVRANWKLWHENGIDPFHVPTVHATFFDFATKKNVSAVKSAGAEAADQLAQPKYDPAEMMKSRKSLDAGKPLDLGNGHLAYGYHAPRGRPFAQWHPDWGPDVKREIDDTYAKLIARVGEEKAEKMAHQNRHILIFPNMAILDHDAIMIRTYFSEVPDVMTVNSWTLGRKDEGPEMRRVRLQNYSEFLGPAGFGTPDDIEAIEKAQRGYRASGDYGGWNDVSGGMAPKKEASRAAHGDEARIRVYWSNWAKQLGITTTSVGADETREPARYGT